MPAHHFLEGELEGRYIEGPGQAQGRGDVVEGTAGLELVEEPESLLSEGEGKLAIPGYRLNRRREVLLTPLGLLDALGELSEGRGFEQSAKGEIDLEGGADA